jgi:DNA processing protein
MQSIREEQTMVELTETGILTGTAEELYGPLNDVERKNAPPRLWLQGDVELLRQGRRVAVVGSRSPSPAGQQRAAQLARKIAGEGITVVSGLALGIDTIAHQTALAAGGRTIAVLGTPLDECQPRQNAGLQERIGRDHLLVSQFPPGHPVLRSNFPRRNRTMALFCHASVIVEAGESSGTLSQGWEALRLGRPLFLLKSVVDNPDLKWPREMIEYGAFVLTDFDDLIEILPATDLPVETLAF